ncbi:MAG: hypothetical protein P1U40_04210 [Coxiellaceae bacterium]|nr:hypothetical protein [Coxiellaceae bacterium]
MKTILKLTAISLLAMTTYAFAGSNDVASGPRLTLSVPQLTLDYLEMDYQWTTANGIKGSASVPIINRMKGSWIGEISLPANAISFSAHFVATPAANSHVQTVVVKPSDCTLPVIKNDSTLDIQTTRGMENGSPVLYMHCKLIA